MGLLDGGLAQEIGTNADMLELMLDGTLSRVTDGTLLDGYWQEGEMVEYPVKGFLDTRLNAVFGKSERIAIILAYGLSVEPIEGDSLTLQGETNQVQSVEKDPAGATYTMVLTRV